MNRGARYGVQRARRAARVRDVVVLLDRLAALAEMPPHLAQEVAEMRLRFRPAPGVRSPIKHTNYTGRKN